MSDLQKLIEAVERGTLTGSDKMFYPTGTAEMITRAVGGEWLWEDVCLAHDGDLNSARDLHEALLPGWEARPVINCGTDKYAHCVVENNDDYNEVEVCNLKCPARAWLLAILRAYAAQQAADAITDRG